MSLNIKAEFKEEMRRFHLEATAAKPTYEELHDKVRSIFKFGPHKRFSLRYKDEENDWISLSSDEELSLALALVGSDSAKLLRLSILDFPSRCGNFQGMRGRWAERERNGGEDGAGSLSEEKGEKKGLRKVERLQAKLERLRNKREALSAKMEKLSSSSKPKDLETLSFLKEKVENLSVKVKSVEETLQKVQTLPKDEGQEEKAPKWQEKRPWQERKPWQERRRGWRGEKKGDKSNWRLENKLAKLSSKKEQLVQEIQVLSDTSLASEDMEKLSRKKRKLEVITQKLQRLEGNKGTVTVLADEKSSVSRPLRNKEEGKSLRREKNLENLQAKLERFKNKKENLSGKIEHLSSSGKPKDLEKLPFLKERHAQLSSKVLKLEEKRDSVLLSSEKEPDTPAMKAPSPSPVEVKAEAKEEKKELDLSDQVVVSLLTKLVKMGFSIPPVVEK